MRRTYWALQDVNTTEEAQAGFMEELRPLRALYSENSENFTLLNLLLRILSGALEERDAVIEKAMPTFHADIVRIQRLASKLNDASLCRSHSREHVYLLYNDGEILRTKCGTSYGWHTRFTVEPILFTLRCFTFPERDDQDAKHHSHVCLTEENARLVRQEMQELMQKAIKAGGISE